MRVAFDVKGTIEGPKKDLVLKLFRGLQEKGHTCIVWSNLYSYAIDAVVNNKLENTEPNRKYSKGDVAEGIYASTTMFDLAVEDDRSQTWLAANRFLFVDEITEDSVKELLRTA